MEKKYKFKYKKYEPYIDNIFNPFENIKYIKCCDCINFVRDTIGDGTGIGQCQINGNYQKTFIDTALYPNIIRKCKNFEFNLL